MSAEPAADDSTPQGDGDATRTASGARMSDARDEPGAGGFIGRYRLLEKLGEGGCGVVFLAEQTEPVRRRVALKVIKLGMDTKSVIARFEAERQALAMMDHPNIAKVFDAGATEAGRPYFVMEWVRGLRITEYCDQHQISTRQRLELFLQVCQAIQHAHQKGIIHRDIKPSNILVTVQDDEPVPKVIDFGIAKTMHGRLTDATVFTGFGQFIGTPAYMSPEQAEVTGLDVDTRSDIYSLGVVLYEMLTGRLPFDPKTLAEAGIDEMRRVIREVDPPRPSTRLGTLPGPDFTRVARQRGAVPAILTAQVRGDLDWIVMKALEKQRNRRYESASALAADIGRHMHDEPVTARPPSTVDRCRKFVARHRLAVAAAASVAAALLAGALISTWQAVRAREAERVAKAERAKAVESRTRAEHLLDFMLGDLRSEVQKVGKVDLLESVAGKALDYFNSLDPRDLTDATLLQQARMLRQIGEIRMTQNRIEEASAAFARSLQWASQLVTREPRDAGRLFERGQAEFWIGAVHRKQGTLPAAVEWMTRYRDTCAALLALDPAKVEWRVEMASGLHNLAVLKKDQGDLAGARADFTAKRATLRAILAATPGDLEVRYRVTDTESWLGNLAEYLGDYPAALRHYAEEDRGLAELQQAEPATARWRFERADGLSFQAGVLAVTGERGEAKRRIASATELIDALVAHDPSNRDWAISAQRLRLRAVELALADGEPARAREQLGPALAAMEAMVQAVPTNRNAKAVLAALLRVQSEILAAGQPAAATVAIGRALQLAEEHGRARQVREVDLVELAHTCVVAAELALAQGRRDEGQGYARRALEVLAPRLPRSRDWRLLDPAARAHALLDQAIESRRLVTLLEQSGYRPLKPWPQAPLSTVPNSTKPKLEAK